MVNSLNNSSSFAMDGQSLAQLRLQAKQSPDQALELAAQQFESVFMNMMLKSMRDATPQDGMMDSDQTRMFTGMLDQQLAQNLSGRGIGLADMMVKQLSRNGLGSAPLPVPGVQQLPAELPASSLNIESRIQPPVAVPSAFSANTQQDFVKRMLPHAMQASAATGVPPQLMLGQAALESGWGRREITMADGSSSYNVFGIKANAAWHGKVAEVMTTEYKNGLPSKQVEKFRAYSSYAEAFKDYAGMMSRNPRYASVMQQGDNPAGMAQAIQKSGYATDPKYAEKLVSVMRQLNISG
ncbi:MAG: flagellar rod assembly protein/muramidase FlgJ [Gallionellales bacterium RIFOXYB12_FULL_54_9]|nr:MAG: flagellar rod assembly protein/muramidase FlgJ [Gallionellales bacterium RIFOXYB12_FULL_54_9]